ncbi:recombinase family protein [Natronococcus occultus]|uniref:Site-specific recombinase, DNA invertase Pin n=1 Tax=Natronococcus occultus SP4 TaxID=694430 RepID=L0JYC1_9EURY|nr:recombinase family protein [Natronococcus occultus]AGB38052.1 site-specific recombinase, DNA invertase Pin [Natronococcus occultus SP4]
MTTGTTAIYVRVSTQKQELEIQKQNCWDYCIEDLNVEPSDIEVYEDKATGANLKRDGYDELMQDAENGEVSRVVVREVSRFARNMRDLNRTIGRLCDDNNAAVHVLDSGLQINEGEEQDGLFDDRLVMQILGIAAELEHKLTKERTKAGLQAAKEAGKHTGRPPYGFETDNEGYLVPDEDYDTARAVIDLVEEDGESIRAASRHTGVARSTIRNIIKRKDMYLDGIDLD